MQERKIMVIERKLLREFVCFAGFMAYDEVVSQIIDMINSSHIFIERKQAERNPDFQQIIPYSFMQFEDRLFLLRRRKNNGRAELRNKYSVFAGGHIDLEDSQDKNILLTALQRELAEEFKVNSDLAPTFSLVGLINDTSSSVGCMHLAVVFATKVNFPLLRINGNDSGNEFKGPQGNSASGSFISLTDIIEYIPNMDRWSKILMEQYFGLTIEASQLTFSDYLEKPRSVLK